MLPRVIRSLLVGGLCLSLTMVGQAPSVGAASPVPGDSPLLPAGMQFTDGVLDLPAGLPAAFAMSVAEHEGTRVIPDARIKRGSTMPVVHVRPPGGAWRTVAVDSLAGYRPPRGFPSRSGVSPTALAAGPDGFVMTGRAQFWDSRAQHRTTVQSLLWHSSDGLHWTRVDPRSVVGSDSSLSLTGVTATPDGGFVAVGTLAPQDLRGKSRIVVLQSADGEAWSKAATLDDRWSLVADGVHVVGDRLLLTGGAYVCTADSFHLATFATGRQLRLWHGRLDGTGFEPIPFDDAGVLVDPSRAPASAKDCPGFDKLNERFATTGQLLAVVDGAAAAISADGTELALSADLEHWVRSTPPGLIPADPTADRDVRARLVTAQADGSLAFLSLEARRDAEDHVIGGTVQVQGWRSADLGTTWERLPAPRPLDLGADFTSLFALPDGAVVLTHAPLTGTGDGSDTSVLVSQAGPLSPWGTCTPSAGADCAFATLADLDLAGADLAGIDLTAASVTGGDWSGVSLRDGRLRSAVLDAPMTGADLTGADAQHARFLGDVGGMVLGGADLSGATVPLSLLMGDHGPLSLRYATVQVPTEPLSGVVMEGVDLYGGRLESEDPTVIAAGLKGADFTGARLVGARFDALDLSGADFAGALLDGSEFNSVNLSGASMRGASWGPPRHISGLVDNYGTGLTFFNDVTCPDGKPREVGAYDQSACRLPRTSK